MKCIVCGSELLSGSDFCPVCGAWAITIPRDILTNGEYLALESEAVDSLIRRELGEFETIMLNGLEESLNPQELVVKPELLARWREWGVPENIIRRIALQRARVRELRRVEEWIIVPDYAYTMPRLEDVEARAWGVAKSIDYEGTIYVRTIIRKDRIARINGWLYRYEYQRPRIVIETRTYEIIEEIANMLRTAVTVIHVYDHRLRRRVIAYRTAVSGARAVRLAYLIEPHLKHPEKKRRAKEILETYRVSPEIRVA